MRLRAAEARAAGRDTRIRQQWMPFSAISPVLKRAVTVTEDAAFWSHDGVDYAEIRASLRTGLLHGGLFRGASTLTQQLAKNLYLSPYRKLEELLITRRLEATLSKTRIFELYLNDIEWGDGIWGADAAAHAYFNGSAASLSNDEAALLAGAIINPRLYSPAHPNARLRRRQAIVLARLGGAPAASNQFPPDLGDASGDADTDKSAGQ
jgi:monofunctional biosynthetic peptidoglycan transglycosylase